MSEGTTPAPELIEHKAVDVVFVHGLWMTGLESQVLAHRLRRDFGLECHRFAYPTTRLPMADISARLDEFVRRLEVPRLHFLGHSLGGLVIHRLFERFPQQPAGRVVFLGSPCVGSRAAERAARWPGLRRLMGPCVAEELLRHQERRWPATRDLGLIAGRQSLGFGRILARFDEDNDGTVAVSETRLPGARAHLTLPVSHLGMLVSARVARAVGTFLGTGAFEDPPARSTSQDGSRSARSR